MGAAYGTAKSGVGIASMGVMRPELVMKSIVPVIMAGVLGIYGLIIAVIISTGGEQQQHADLKCMHTQNGCLPADTHTHSPTSTRPSKLCCCSSMCSVNTSPLAGVKYLYLYT
jgi:hypothetical protein